MIASRVTGTNHHSLFHDLLGIQRHPNSCSFLINTKNENITGHAFKCKKCRIQRSVFRVWRLFSANKSDERLSFFAGVRGRNYDAEPAPFYWSPTFQRLGRVTSQFLADEGGSHTNTEASGDRRGRHRRNRYIWIPAKSNQQIGGLWWWLQHALRCIVRSSIACLFTNFFLEGTNFKQC